MCRPIKKHNKSIHEKIKLFNIEHVDNASFRIEYGKDGHISSIHETKTLFSCEICGVSFRHRSILRNHEGTVHEENSSTISVDASLISVHEGEKPFKCTICDYKCSTNQHMTLHISSVHEDKKPFKCNICDKSFSETCAIKNHTLHGEKLDTSPEPDSQPPIINEAKEIVIIEKVHEGNQPFQCSKCDKCVSRILMFKKILLKKHNKSIHEKIKLFNIEHIDDASFRIEYGTDGHISSIHPTKKLFSCEICGDSFGHRSILKNRKVTVHEQNSSLSSSLSVDESLISVDESLISVHEGEKPFKCTICEYKCLTKQMITKHIGSVHEGKKPF